MTDMDIVYAAKQKYDEEGGEDNEIRTEGGENKSEIRTALRSLDSSQIETNIPNYFSK
jgi:hypothetical protein